MSSQLKALVIGHVWPQPNATAAGAHLMDLISFFQKLSCEILFVSAAQKPIPYTLFEQYGITSQIIELNDNTFDTILQNFQPNVVLFDRFITEEQFSWRVYKNCPNAIRILDTEDLHFLRKQRQENFIENTQKKKDTPNETLSDTFKREIASIYRCDLSLIISLKEMEMLITKYQIPKNLLHYTPLLSKFSSDKLGKKNTSPVFEERQDIMFVGNFLHQPNWDAVQYLKKDIWPELSKKLPKVNLHIYGSHAAAKHLQLSNPKQRFLVHGYVEDLNAVMQNARLLLAPLRFGAGQKGKIVNAMENGLPNVTTPIGAEGMQLDLPWAGSIAEKTADILDQTVALYSNKTLWQEAQNNGFTLLKKQFEYELHFTNFKTQLTLLSQKMTKHRNQNIVGALLWHHSLRSTEYLSRWIEEKNKAKNN